MPETKANKTAQKEQEILVISEIWEEMQKMTPQKVKLDQVYLDPNNPRLEVFKREAVPLDRVTELGIQQAALEHLRSIGIGDLIESIRASGFCTIDRIVLKPQDDKYMVVEGNRRMAALKVLQDEHNKGRITIPDNILKGILEFEALVYKGERDDIAWIVQGFRHAPEAIKEWEDYSKAKFFSELERRGKKASDIAKMFNIKPRSQVPELIRSYCGFEQAAENEDYGGQLDPQGHFSFFTQIIFVKPELRKWLGWDDTAREFDNLENLNKFLSWIFLKKIDISPTTRDYLPQLLYNQDYSDILDMFEREKGLDIHECRISIDDRKPKPAPDISQLLLRLDRIKTEIDILPLTRIKKLGKTREEKEQKDKVISLLRELKEAVEIQISFLSKK